MRRSAATESGSGSEKEEQGPAASSDFKPRKHFGKDPTVRSVDTGFLYDADREADLQRKRKELIAEYTKEQEAAKHQKVEFTYSYRDGSGHRRITTREKGFTIAQFLANAKRGWTQRCLRHRCPWPPRTTRPWPPLKQRLCGCCLSHPRR